MIKLGDKVRDKVSGFTGIAISRHTYLEGCTRISIQPEIDKDGKLPAINTFDEPLVEIIESQKIVKREQSEYNGGPEKYMPSKKETGDKTI
jgi:hypothetical protein